MKMKMKMKMKITMLREQDIVKGEVETLLSTANPHPIKTIYLSNIDQLFAFPIETVFFYDSGAADIVERVRSAISDELLLPYYFLAGRLGLDPRSKRLELHCNNPGVLFSGASASGVSLADLGDLSQPNPSFERLILRVDDGRRSIEDTPIFTVQVTTFACGGFCLGFSVNHSVLDGKAMTDMFECLASICRGESGGVHRDIDLDRSCLRPRDPPRIEYDHDEYIKPDDLTHGGTSFTSSHSPPPPPCLPPTETPTWKVFNFSSEMIDRLKEKCDGGSSTFEVVVAQLWRARTAAVLAADEATTVFFSVDIRSRMSPPLPAGFAGNAVMGATATAAAEELMSKPFPEVVMMVREAIGKVTDEYSRSVIDWLEVHRGLPAVAAAMTGGGGRRSGGSFVVSAWWKLPFHELDFGFGRPVCSSPVVVGAEFVLLLASHGGGGGGINVLVALREDEMERFARLVYVL